MHPTKEKRTSYNFIKKKEDWSIWHALSVPKTSIKHPRCTKNVPWYDLGMLHSSIISVNTRRSKNIHKIFTTYRVCPGHVSETFWFFNYLAINERRFRNILKTFIRYKRRYWHVLEFYFAPIISFRTCF